MLLALVASLSVPSSGQDGESLALGVYGNANLDDTIDERDIAFVKEVISGAKPANNLTDANYDGKVDEEDIAQIEKIISDEETELTVVSRGVWDEGPAVTVHKPVKSVLTRFFDSAEALRIMDSTDKIVAVGCKNFEENSAFFPELCKLPYVAETRTSELDNEAILSMKPDLFLGWYKEDREKLPGINMIHSKLWGLNSTNDIKKLGYILDKEKEAEEYIEWHDSCISRINEQVENIPEDERPSVLVALIEPGGIFGVYSGFGGTTGMDNLMTMIPMKSIGQQLPMKTYAEVDTEWVIEQNPDIIIIASNFAEGKTANGTGRSFAGYDLDDPSQVAAERDEFLSRPELSEVKAVKEGKVYMMEYKLFSYSQSMIIGAVYLAKWIYPDLDLNPETIHQEYLTRFQHLDYDLNEHGVFAYPPIEVDDGLAGIPDRYKGNA
jgi:iron complex transport system substrate-binding protein